MAAEQLGSYANSLDTIEQYTKRVRKALVAYLRSKVVEVYWDGGELMPDIIPTQAAEYRTRKDIFQDPEVIQNYFETIYRNFKTHVSIYQINHKHEKLIINFLSLEMNRPIQIEDDGNFIINTRIGYLVLGSKLDSE